MLTPSMTARLATLHHQERLSQAAQRHYLTRALATTLSRPDPVTTSAMSGVSACHAIQRAIVSLLTGAPWRRPSLA
jgi:hypothetical protein